MKSTNAKMQCQLTADDLQTVLAMVRTGTLAKAAIRLGVDSSTVFRNITQLERSMGQALFVRSRNGFAANELAQLLAQHGEKVEAELVAARTATHATQTSIAGTVRITTTDTLLHGLLMPALRSLATAEPLLEFELTASNDLASLTQRDADIALRATKKPPPHLVGRNLGSIKMAVFASKKHPRLAAFRKDLSQANWIAPDDALPEHLSVKWRKQHHPKLAVRYQVNSIASVLEGVRAGLGVGIVPIFWAKAYSDVVAVSDELPECATQLWLLTHSESRHLRRISAVYKYLGETIELPD
jgi:DNA-binding transcriptional LysR family regulator